jgi:kynurenine 3-monooxygenase
MTPHPQTITLIGAGLNGPLLAMGLVQRGFRVEIYERRPDMRRMRVHAGRSINLALSTRGIHALSQLGLWDEMRRIIVPMRGRMMHAVRGELTFQRYGKDESEVINSISRADLNIALMNTAEARGVRILFQERCIGMDLTSGALQFRDQHDGAVSARASEVVIGCDGSASAVRDALRKCGGTFRATEEQLDYGYKELIIPSVAGKHAMEPHALHIWPRGNFMLIALPNVDGTFGCILFLPFQGRDSFERLKTASAVLDFFQSHFPDALPLMPGLAENFFGNPTGGMVTVKCSPWHASGRALLLGDAAHAIVPFFGQGINCGFEDCSILFDLLDRYGSAPDWEHVFTAFEHGRKPNTDAIADLAVENFIEMRDQVADPRFLFRKNVELALEGRYPNRFVPKYAMVTFHRIPYATARDRGRIQDVILTELCEPIHRIDELDWNRAEELVCGQLPPLELT